MVLFRLASIAEAGGDLDRAEPLYRESLTIATELESTPDIADVSLDLGRFLVERRGNRDEGLPMLDHAARLYAEIGLPDAEDARATAQRLGCLPAL